MRYHLLYYSSRKRLRGCILNRRDFLFATICTGVLGALSIRDAVAVISDLANEQNRPSPFIKFILDRFTKFRRGELSPEKLVYSVEQKYKEFAVDRFVSEYIDESLYLSEVRPIYKKKFNSSNSDAQMKLQLFFLRPGTSHAPHAHHNLMSVQHVVRGRLYVREYERVAKFDEEHVLIKPYPGFVLEPSEGMCTTEKQRNIHWFGVEGNEPAIVLNFNIRGAYSERDLFDSTVETPNGRDFLDARGVEVFGNKLLVGRLEREEANAIFARSTVREIDTLL